MYYEIYIDQFYIQNVVILLFLLKSCGKISRRCLTWKRIWLVSLAEAAVSCLVLFLRLSGGPLLLTGIGMLLAAAKWGLNCKSRREILAGMAGLLAISAFYSGLFQLIFSVWEPPVFLAAAVIYTMAEILIDKQRERMVLEECRAEITLEDQGDRWRLTGLIDTGNHLKEPLTGRPVSILDPETAGKLPRCRRIWQEQNGYLYIPFRSIGREKGWMMGIVIDAMDVEYRGEKIRVTHPVLAVSREPLSLADQYQMIVNPLHTLHD